MLASFLETLITMNQGVFLIVFAMISGGSLLFITALQHLSGTTKESAPHLSQLELAYLFGGLPHLLRVAALQFGTHENLVWLSREHCEPGPHSLPLNATKLERELYEYFLNYQSDSSRRFKKPLSEVRALHDKLIQSGLLLSPSSYRVRLAYTTIPVVLLGVWGLIYIVKNPSLGFGLIFFTIFAFYMWSATLVRKALRNRLTPSGRSLLESFRNAYSSIREVAHTPSMLSINDLHLGLSIGLLSPLILNSEELPASVVSTNLAPLEVPPDLSDLHTDHTDTWKSDSFGGDISNDSGSDSSSCSSSGDSSSCSSCSSGGCGGD